VFKVDKEVHVPKKPKIGEKVKNPPFLLLYEVSDE